MKKIKKPISIVLALMMVVSLFAIVPITASAAVGDFVPEKDYLTFTAEEDNSWVMLNYQKILYGDTFKYNKNNSGWEDYTNKTQIDLKKGDSVRFRAKAPMYGQMFGQNNHFSIGGKVACSGNVMSLRLDDNGMSQGLSIGCFNYLFYNCTGLTAAPELPETTLATECYSNMFNRCTSLTTAPALPATTLAGSCYMNMFSASGLTTAPALPATKLAYACYSAMFSSCTSLTALPALPATTLSSSCYSYMFAGCSKIKLSETQTAEYSIPYSVPSGEIGTGSSSALEGMFLETGGTFKGTPEINKTYYMYREVPKYTVTWKNGDTTLETDTDVEEGATPTYDGATPTKDGVTFAGWTDSHGVFYARDATLPEVTADETYTAVFELTIGSVDEWNSFAASVKGGNTYSGMIVRMTADVGPVTTMVDGTFSGTFDGDGHTLTVNISGGSTSAATFAYVKDATIQNLRLEGTVTSSGIHTAALVKSVSDTGSTCTIKNVDIYADVNCSQGYIGGFIGHAGVANTVNIENSIFAGSINKTGSTQGFIGAFIGWSQKLTATINNCAFTGSYNNINSFNNIGFSYNAPTKVTVSGFYSNASEVFVANVNHGTRLYVPSSSYPTTVALVKNNDGETFYSAFSDALAAWTDGSTLALLADVTCDSMISVPANTSKILDLNGKTLTTVATNTVYGTLTIQSTVSGGNIIHTNKSQVISVKEEATLNINSGTIHGYNADRAVIGGAEGGTYNLNGGKIVTSASNAFSIGSGSTLNLNGGEIECTSGSTSMGTASAVWSHGDSTINWNGTAITTNTGDGIRMKSAGNGTVNVTGGSFTATSSSLPEEGGYAVYVNSNMSSLNLKGNPSFSGRGIYLTNDKVINITNELSNTNPISVTMQTPGVFTSGLSGNGDASNFANGNGTGYAITLNASGEAQMVPTYTVTWKNGDTVLETDADVAAGSPAAYNGETPTKADAVCCTFTFAGWNDGTNTYSATDTLPAVTGDITYTATFESVKRSYTITWKNEDGSVIDTTTVEYGETPTHADPEKAATAQYNYTFLGWSPAVTAVTGNAEYTATFSSAVNDYTVTWKNGDDVLKTDTVAYGEIPVYTGSDPEKADDADYTYTFAGWSPAIVPVTEDVTYTATYTATEKPKKLITGQSITLDGNIGINFYLDPAAAGLTVNQVTADNFRYTFAWADDVSAKVNVAEQSGSTFVPDGDLIKVTCKVCAAEMTCGVKANFNLNGITESKTYSVRQYADTILSDGTQPEALKELIKAMLNYGAMAQTKFKVNLGYLANKNVTFAKGDVTDDMLETAIAAANGTNKADNMNDVAAQHGAKWYSTSLIYLDNNTIRHYFVKDTDAFKPSDYKANKANYYYYVEKTDIPAAELDNLQTFNVGNDSFKYSALDFVKGMIHSSADEESQNLAKSLYWYNQAANEYFPAPVHVHTPGTAVQENVVPATCSATGSYDEVVYCTECGAELSREAKTIAKDPNAHATTAVREENIVPATCTSEGSYDAVTYCTECMVEISRVHTVIPLKLHQLTEVAEVPATTAATGVAAHYECSVCHKLFSDAQGNNETTAEALVIPKLVDNVIDINSTDFDGNAKNGDVLTGTLTSNKKITIADGATVTLKDANITCLSSNAKFAAITPLGDATIMLEGTNTVKGGYEDYPGVFVPVGKTLTIDGTGSLNASSNGYGCGIGGGYEKAAGNIVINGGTITATGGTQAAGIGSGQHSSCGTITVNGGTIIANVGSYAAGIGSGYFGSSCGNITIDGGIITATGGNDAAGIGSGYYSSSCGNITISANVTSVTATKGSEDTDSIGAGYNSSCGTVTIEDGANVIQN